MTERVHEQMKIVQGEGKEKKAYLCFGKIVFEIHVQVSIRRGSWMQRFKVPAISRSATPKFARRIGSWS